MKFLVFTLLISLVVNAQLPDEINYSPYKQRLNTITDQLDDSKYDLNLKMELLKEKLQAISYTENLISDLHSQISNNSLRLNRLRESLPGLRVEIQNLESSIFTLNGKIRSSEQKLSNLRSKIQRIKGEINPIETKINNRRSALKRTRNAKRSALSKKSKLETSLVNKNTQVSKNHNTLNQNRSSILNLESKLTSSKSDLSRVNSKISTLQSKLVNAKSSEGQAKSSLSSAKDSLSLAKSNLRSLQSGGASSAKIQSAKEKVSALEVKISRLTSKYSSAKSKVRSLANKKSTTVSQKKKLEGIIRSIPTKISKLKIAINNALRSNQSLKSEIVTLESKVQAEKKVIDQLSIQEIKHKSSISRLSDKIAPLRNRVHDLKQKRSRVSAANKENLRRRKKLITSLDKRFALHNNNKRQIPILTNTISRSKQNLSIAHSDLSKLNSDEQLIRIEISQTQTIIRDLTYDQTQAKHEFNERLSLFNHYENEASTIGSSQNTNGEEFGVDAGEDYSNRLVLLNAKSLSDEIGYHKARLIGTVRGEIDGYAIGYEKGFKSEDSISEGIENGIDDGKSNALQYAQNTLRPNFFETFLSELLNKKAIVADSTKNLLLSKNLEGTDYFSFSKENIPSLTQAEFEESSTLKTSLDSSIAALITSDFQLDAKLNNFKKADFVFKEITTVPYQQIDCNSVYKGLSIYKSKCEQSYKKSFSHSFKSKVKETFYMNYPLDFFSEYGRLLDIKIDGELEGFYSEAKGISSKEAKVIGKKDAYNKYYEESYANSYNSQLKIESSIASSQAKRDVNTWILTNPVVTVKSISINRPVLKGGDTAELLIELKNVSNVDSINSGVLNLVGLNKVMFSKTSFKLADVKANSAHVMRIPFTVDHLASSFDHIRIDTEFILKGDKYKTSRLELLSLRQQLSKNAKFDITYNFNSTPKVKRFRKYYIHSFDFNITSTVENISEGYDVKLVPLDGADKYLSFKKNNLNSQATTVNVLNKTTISYVFKKSAKKRKLNFKAIISFKGLVLSEKVVQITPR